MAEGANGHAEETGAPPANGRSKDKPKNGNGAAASGDSSKGGNVSWDGASVETQSCAEAPKDKSASGNGHGPAVDFNQLRNEVLTLARRPSSTSKQDIADVVSRASDGSFQYSDIGRMTPADLPKVRLGTSLDLPATFCNAAREVYSPQLTVNSYKDMNQAISTYHCQQSTEP